MTKYIISQDDGYIVLNQTYFSCNTFGVDSLLPKTKTSQGELRLQIEVGRFTLPSSNPTPTKNDYISWRI